MYTKEITFTVITPHAQRVQGKVISVGVYMSIYTVYISVYMFVDQKIELYLTIDLPFQTFAVGLLVKFID